MKFLIKAFCIFKNPYGRQEEHGGIQDLIGIEQIWELPITEDDFIALHEEEHEDYFEMGREAATDLEIAIDESAPSLYNSHGSLKCEHVIIREAMRIEL